MGKSIKHNTCEDSDIAIERFSFIVYFHVSFSVVLRLGAVDLQYFQNLLSGMIEVGTVNSEVEFPVIFTVNYTGIRNTSVAIKKNLNISNIPESPTFKSVVGKKYKVRNSLKH